VPREQRHRIAELEVENADQRQEIEGQRNKIDELVGEVDRLRGQVAELQAKLNTSSQSSSAPPSSDSPGKKAEARKSRSERRREERANLKAEARRRGKQPGAPGKNLPMQDDPDNIVPHEPPHCSNCGKDLSGAEQAGDPEHRQVLDLCRVSGYAEECEKSQQRGGNRAETLGVNWVSCAPLDSKNFSRRRQQPRYHTIVEVL